jgi:methyl-accepting chemotaxis protein/aerotaxis receptor
MLNNGPVTNQEVLLGEDDVLISKTDPGGVITYVNEAFVRFSGFLTEELIGQPHNIVRHPDMPPVAYEDLWATIRAGESWEGFVKNRTKSGDFYWARASVSALVEGGAIVGFVSVRSRMSRDEVVQAEDLYARMRSGQADNVVIAAGSARINTPKRRMLRHLRSVRGHMQIGSVTQLFLILLFGLIGLFGMRYSNNALEGVYEDRTTALVQVQKIAGPARDAMFQLILMRDDMARGASIDKRMSRIGKDREQIASQLERFSNWSFPADDKDAAAAFFAVFPAIDKELIGPALDAAKQGDNPRWRDTRGGSRGAPMGI